MFLRWGLDPLSQLAGTEDDTIGVILCAALTGNAPPNKQKEVERLGDEVSGIHGDVHVLGGCGKAQCAICSLWLLKLGIVLVVLLDSGTGVAEVEAATWAVRLDAIGRGYEG